MLAYVFLYNLFSIKYLLFTYVDVLIRNYINKLYVHVEKKLKSTAYKQKSNYINQISPILQLELIPDL